MHMVTSSTVMITTVLARSLSFKTSRFLHLTLTWMITTFNLMWLPTRNTHFVQNAQWDILPCSLTGDIQSDQDAHLYQQYTLDSPTNHCILLMRQWFILRKILQVKSTVSKTWINVSNEHNIHLWNDDVQHVNCGTE